MKTKLLVIVLILVLLATSALTVQINASRNNTAIVHSSILPPSSPVIVNFANTIQSVCGGIVQLFMTENVTAGQQVIVGASIGYSVSTGTVQITDDEGNIFTQTNGKVAQASNGDGYFGTAVFITTIATTNSFDNIYLHFVSSTGKDLTACMELSVLDLSGLPSNTFVSKGGSSSTTTVCCNVPNRAFGLNLNYEQVATDDNTFGNASQIRETSGFNLVDINNFGQGERVTWDAGSAYQLTNVTASSTYPISDLSSANVWVEVSTSW